MPTRLKLMLPALAVLALTAAALVWLVAHGADGTPALAAGGAVVLLAMLQALAHERWVLGTLRALRGLLMDAPGDTRDRAVVVAGIEWRAAEAGIRDLRKAAAQDRQTMRDAVARARHTEDQLRLAEERYTVAIRGAGDGLWEWDPGQASLRVSPRWRSMLGLDGKDECIAIADWLARVHPKDRERAMSALHSSLDAGSRGYEHQYRVAHADGRYRWVLSRGTVIRHASGRPSRLIGLDTDVTRIRRAETIIDAIAEGTAGTAGECFFRSLVRAFARALEIDCAMITECADQPPTRARTLAIWSGGRFESNFEYELAGTPCEFVIRGARPGLVREHLGRLFPRETGHESYLGLPILARSGRVLGHLAFLDIVPMGGDMVIDSVHRVFTARAAVEIELAHALAACRGNAAVAERS